MGKRITRTSQTTQFPWEQIEGATGASDATSGGGAGAGIPEPETVESTGGRAARGNVRRDKKKIFPEKFGKAALSRPAKARRKRARR